MDPQVALMLALSGTAVSFLGLYLRISARDQAAAKWQGAIDEKVSNLGADVGTLHRRIDSAKSELNMRLDKMPGEIHKDLTEIKRLVNKMQIALARSGINGDKHGSGGGRLAMLGAIAGFVAPFLPDVVKLFKQRLDHKQEMEMLELRLTHASKEHEWRMREIETAADAADLRSARKPRESYGVQLLNAAAGHVGENAVIAPKTFSRAFLLFTLTDLFSAAVRPAITYWIVGLWGTVKMALLYSLYTAAGGEWHDKVVGSLTAEGSWTTFDQDVLAVVIGFWFGWRTRQRAAGQR